LTSTNEIWIARTASALCVASRWVSGGSIALALLAALAAWSHATDGATSRAALALVVVAGAAQAYLAVRIEFDRRIFDALRPGETLEGFDAALGELGWLGARSAGKPVVGRASGLARLVRRAGWLFGAQVAIAAAIPWMPG
jgi:hypothetical protein